MTPLEAEALAAEESTGRISGTSVAAEVAAVRRGMAAAEESVAEQQEEEEEEGGVAFCEAEAIGEGSLSHRFRHPNRFGHSTLTYSN